MLNAAREGAAVNATESKYLAELYKTNSNGSTQHWRIWVEGNVIKTEHGKLGGKLTESAKEIKVGKNIGKANETTPEEQALSEAMSTIQKKRDKNYGDDPGHTEIAVLPMLAHNFRKREKSILYPCYVQPKLDGIRCFAHLTEDGDIKLISRSGKEFIQPFETLRAQIKEHINANEIWDGELYTSELTFEQITAACRKGTYRDTSESIEFHLFDIFVDDKECFDFRFETRMARLFMKLLGRIVPVETLIVQSKEEAMEYYARCMANGFEGIMFRNCHGLYKAGHRSVDLQKYKEFIDEEFTIVGSKEGTGSDAGTVIWRCETNLHGSNPGIFDVRPRGTVAERKEMFVNRKQYLGKQLIVRYQNLTEYGIPRFPVGIVPRDYE